MCYYPCPDGLNGCPDGANVTPVNKLLHSLFSKVDVMLNGKTVCSSDYHYAHRAYVETLLNFRPDTKKGELTASFWHEDTAGHFDDLTADNVGFTTRCQLARWRNVIPLMGRVHADLFTQPRIMIDGVGGCTYQTYALAMYLTCIKILDHASIVKLFGRHKRTRLPP